MFWQCRRKKKVTVNKRAKLERCNFKLSVRTNTWFHNSSLSFEKVCSIITQYLLLNPPHAHYLQNEFKISPNTYNDWASYIREICEYWVFKNCSEKIGGRRQIVEIDEAKCGSRKYNRGRVIEGKWIFGGIERESNLFFMEPVMDRSKKTLLEVIKRRIKPGTTIISDCWKAYDCLNDEGFKHLTVNHTYNFVDPDSGAHTQHIERIWRTARASIPRFGCKEENML